MLVGYHFVLSVPLLLIVPFAAYRSLAGERDDGTYELLSITTLSSRQIVTGKLGSAVLQMVIYYSALAPCIAFTYLLRGVDVLTIGLVLFYTFLASMLLSVFGLAVAASRGAGSSSCCCRWRSCWAWSSSRSCGAFGGCRSPIQFGRLPFDSPDFWIGQVALVSGYISYFCLFLFAAAAQLSFASDNRSTKLRIVMLVQQVLFTGWMMYYWLGRSMSTELLYVWLVFSGIHWVVMGALMTGELAPLSPRVKRQLPQSFFGPGVPDLVQSGFGHGLRVRGDQSGGRRPAGRDGGPSSIEGLNSVRAPRDPLQIIIFGGLVWGYVAAYLGVGRLLVLALRRVLYFGLLLPFLVHLVLALAGAAFPTLLHAWLYGLNSLNDYTPLQATNWFWTLVYAGQGKLLTDPIVPLLVTVFATVMLVVNLVLARREVEQTRQEAPQRVHRDELELHPERFVVEAKPASPFDDD